MNLRVSAVQLKFSYAHTPQQFFDHVSEPIERAAREGAQLVVLPNYTGLQLLGIPVPAANDTFSLHEIAGAAQFPSVAAMLRQVAPTMRNFFVRLFVSLAQRLHVYLAAGTVIEREGGRLYNAAYLFEPDGTIVGSQRQTHRAPYEIEWGLAQGETLTVFDIGIARVGFVVGTDVAYPEVSRILALQRANLLIHSAAYGMWGVEHFLFDLWREVQANQVSGLQACMVGSGFKGRSAVYLPVESTTVPSGILAQTTSANGEEIVSAAIHFDAVQEAINTFPIFDFFNYALYTRELPGAYRVSNM